MYELNKQKSRIITQLQELCAHCRANRHFEHNCPISELALKVEHLQGIPLTVNSQFRGMVWVK